MLYLRVTAVPVPRTTNPITSPISEMAARLDVGECAEMRFVRHEGETCCYMGFENTLRVQQVKNLLSLNGFLYAEEDPPKVVETGTLLHRSVERRFAVRDGASPEERLLPMVIETEPARCEALFQCLSSLPNGCGVSFFIRRAKSLPIGTATHLHRINDWGDGICQKMLNSNVLFDAIGCVFGDEKHLAFLISETLYTYSGLAALSVKKTEVNSKLFSAFERYSTAAPVLKPLHNVYLKNELDVLGNLSYSAGQYGIKLNKDTIFGIPHVYKKCDKPTIRLGSSETDLPQEIPLKKLTKHVFIGGAPGSGKGNELFFLVKQLHNNNIPTLIIESAKEEFHHLRKAIPELRTWKAEEGAFVYNPFALQGDITLGEMRASLLQTLRVCFKLDGPLEELFSKTLNRCFAKNGFTDSSTIKDVGVTPFGMSEFMQEYTRLLNETGYSARTRSDVKTAGEVRLNTLFNQNRGVYDSCKTIPIEELLNGFNLIQLNNLTTLEAKQMFASLILIGISAYLRLRGKHSEDLKLAIILDESHNLLQPVTDSDGRPYSFSRDFSNMLLELRSQGVSLIICDQSSDNIPREIVNSCCTKVFLGSSLSGGIGDYAKYLNMDETALNNLYLLETGDGCFVTEGMPKARYFHCPNVIDIFRLGDKYERKNDYLEGNPRLTIETFRECDVCPAAGKCAHADKIAARQIASMLCQKFGYTLEKLIEKNSAEDEDSKKISDLLTRILADVYCEAKTNSATRYCAVVQFVREFNRQHPDVLKVDNLIQNGEKIWAELQKNI